MPRIPLAAVIAAAVIVAGCSSPNGHGAYAKCLQEHGISASPGPAAGPPPGTDQDSWHRATQACASLAPGPSAG